MARYVVGAAGAFFLLLCLMAYRQVGRRGLIRFWPSRGAW